MVDLTNLKRSRPLLLIILILIVVAGGGYYYLYLRKPKPTPPPEEAAEVEFDYPRGTVERIEEGKIAIRTEGGLLELLVDEETDVTFHEESLYEVIHGEAASLEDIKVGDEIAASVKVLSDQSRGAFFIEIFRVE